ncbi:hypothetical protein N7474_002870 [Penicillium riverlandense]|uniref:uncharacterized protein n=1 Tax=Penicillium riverlandense TaxID=1903569 RepID=UPI002547D4C0|nr:uncharacterized protein N7474_002870 [Penicillium riverlandense]KAJ5825732.1 hypothetical protein N7474_002870 [Penicillium riverlandense]
MPLNSKAVYSRQNPSFLPFASRRSVVHHSTNGIVTCTQPLAAAARQRILREGGNAAIKADLDVCPDQTESISKTSALAVTTPDAAAGWVDTVERFGSGKLSLKQILAPAIELAEEGFQVSELSSSFELLKVDPSVKDGVRSPSASEIMKNPTLAQNFRALAADGKKGFYEGHVAEKLVKVAQDWAAI